MQVKKLVNNLKAKFYEHCKHIEFQLLGNLKAKTKDPDMLRSCKNLRHPVTLRIEVHWPTIITSNRSTEHDTHSNYALFIRSATKKNLKS